MRFFAHFALYSFQRSQQYQNLARLIPHKKAYRRNLRNLYISIDGVRNNSFDFFLNKKVILTKNPS